MGQPARVEDERNVAKVPVRQTIPDASLGRGPRGGRGSMAPHPGSKPRSRQAPHTLEHGAKTAATSTCPATGPAQATRASCSRKGCLVRRKRIICSVSARRDPQVGRRHRDNRTAGSGAPGRGATRRAPPARRRSPGPCGGDSIQNVRTGQAMSGTPSPGRATRPRQAQLATARARGARRESAGPHLHRDGCRPGREVLPSQASARRSVPERRSRFHGHTTSTKVTC